MQTVAMNALVSVRDTKSYFGITQASSKLSLFYRRHHFAILDQCGVTGAAIRFFIGVVRSLGLAGNNGIILSAVMGIPLLLLY